RLYSTKAQQRLGPESTVQEIFDAFENTPISDVLYDENLKTIQEHLTKKHGFPLSENDLGGIEYVYHNFYRFGPGINYGSSGRGGFGGVTYADLMTATDAQGVFRSYLATEENFEFMKSLETNNMLVPVVGNFAR